MAENKENLEEYEIDLIFRIINSAINIKSHARGRTDPPLTHSFLKFLLNNMRPTIRRQSDMPGPKTYNLWWGDKGGTRQRGIIQYTISPFQTRAGPHWLKSYLFNGYRRLSGELFFFGVPMAIGYGVYAWAKNYDEWQNSKAGHLAAAAHHD